MSYFFTSPNREVPGYLVGITSNKYLTYTEFLRSESDVAGNPDTPKTDALDACGMGH